MSRAIGSPTDEMQRWCEDAGWVRALAGQLVADADLADDVAQEAWVRALRGPRPAPGAFRAWIAAVLRNLVATQHRGKARRLRHERHVEPPAAADDPLTASARLEAQATLVTAVRGLDEPYRSVIVLRWFEGLAPRAIAARTGVPVRTVHTRLQRAMSQLRARLEARDRRWPALLAPLAFPGRTAAVLAMTTKIKLSLCAGLCAAAIALLAWPEPIGPAPAALRSDNAASLAADIRDGGRAAAPAPAPARRAVPEPAAVATPAVAADVPEPWPLKGLCLDVDGMPLPGIAVAFTGFGHAEASARTTSAADGTFTLTLPEVWGGNLDVDDPAWTTVYRPVLWGNRDVGELTLVAARAAPVAGVVVDESGRGLGGVEVSVSCAAPPRASFPRSLERSLGGEWKVTTGGDGRFEISRAPVLPAMRIHAERTGYRSARLDLTIREGLRIVLESTRSILEGRVVDHDGRPTAAAVFCGKAAAEASADGRFAIDLGGAGEDKVRHTHRWLVAARRGFLPARLCCTGDEPGNPQSWPSPLVLRLGGPALTISGRVLDADGTPLESPAVRALDLEYLGDPSREPGKEMSSVEFLARVEAHVRADGTEFSDQDDVPLGPGGFELRGLQDRVYRLLVEHAATLRSIVTEPIRAGTHGIELRMPAEAMWPAIEGVVVDRRGDPVAGASVWFEREDPAPRGSRRETERVATDADGRFARGPLPLAVRTVLVQCPGIAHGKRFDLTMLGDVGNLRLVAPVKSSVRIVATAASRAADAVAFLDAEGEKIAATITQGNWAWGAFDVALVDGQSEVVTVPDDAVTLVLLKGGDEMSRMAIDLSPGPVQEVRP